MPPRDPDIFGDPQPGRSDPEIFADMKPEAPAPEAPAKAQASRPMPANAGLANFAANALGLPMDTVQNFANLTRAAQGAIATALGKHEWAPPLIENIPGGSQNIKAMLRRTGAPGLSPDNPAPESPMGTAQYDYVSRGGFIPGGALPAAGSMVAEKIGGPEWSGVGAMVPQAAITAYNAARAPSLARQQQENATRDATLSEAQKEGYVVPPSASGGGFLSKRLESIGGKAAVGQEAAVRNQKITNEIARRELGLPKMAPLTEDSLETYRNNLAAPYREVAKIDTEAAQALKDLRQARFDANANYKFYAHTPNPETLTKAQSFAAKAEGLEKYIEDIAANAGKPNLVQDLREARKMIAKTYDVERALNIGTGDVSASALGRSLDKGKPLSGGLATAGKFAEGFPSYARDGAKVPTPGVSKSEAIMGSLLGIGGYSALGPYGTALAALPLLSGPARSLVLSQPYQKMAAPSYGPALSPSPNAQLLYQLGILSQPQN